MTQTPALFNSASIRRSAPALAASVLALLLAACGSPPAGRTSDVARAEAVAPLAGKAAVRTAMPMAVGGQVLYAPSPAGIEDLRPANTEKYGEINTNPVHEVAKEPVSTFSIDVDTGSYANVRRFLNDGRLPPVDAVRVEELINYFPYDYPRPAAGSPHPFGVTTEVAQSPWKADAQLLRIAIQAADKTLGSLPPANLVFLVDVSGSMQAADKLPLVKRTLRLLTEQLRPQDRVTIVTYASGEKLVLPPRRAATRRPSWPW